MNAVFGQRDRAGAGRFSSWPMRAFLRDWQGRVRGGTERGMGDLQAQIDSLWFGAVAG